MTVSGRQWSVFDHLVVHCIGFFGHNLDDFNANLFLKQLNEEIDCEYHEDYVYGVQMLSVCQIRRGQIMRGTSTGTRLKHREYV